MKTIIRAISIFDGDFYRVNGEAATIVSSILNTPISTDSESIKFTLLLPHSNHISKLKDAGIKVYV